MLLKELCKVIRSKNAGPFYITFDVIFNDYKTFNFVIKRNIFTKEKISRLYNLPVNKISIIEYPPSCALKITIVRPVPSGNIKDTDIYGTQQHAPLLDIFVPIEDAG